MDKSRCYKTIGLHVKDGSCRCSLDVTSDRPTENPHSHLYRDITEQQQLEEFPEDAFLSNLQLIHLLPETTSTCTRMMSGGTVEFGPGVELITFRPGVYGYPDASDDPNPTFNPIIRHDCDGTYITIHFDTNAAEYQVFSEPLSNLLDQLSAAQAILTEWEIPDSEVADFDAMGILARKTAKSTITFILWN